MELAQIDSTNFNKITIVTVPVQISLHFFCCYFYADP